MKKINTIVAIQRFFVRGSKKIHIVVVSSFLAKTSMETPDSVYGIVKSTYLDRLAIIVTSPTAASNFCHPIRKNKGEQVNMELGMFKYHWARKKTGDSSRKANLEVHLRYQ